MSRKTKNDWLVAGYETLGESGASTLTIDHLCNRLGVTKGSFYHHFQNYQDYKEQLLAFWEEQLTTSIVAFAEDAGDLSEVLARFHGYTDEHLPRA